jgi:hypothetical protein
MPIDDSALKRNFKVFDPQTTLQQVLDQIDDTEELYVVVRLSSGKYACAPLRELKEVFELPRLQDRTVALNAPLGELLVPFAADAVEQNTDRARWEIESLRKAAPEKRLVVLADGQVVGLLAEKPRTVRKAAPRRPASYGRSAGEEALPEAKPTRIINVELKDQDENPYDAKARPLQLTQTYILVCDVDEVARAASLVSKVLLEYKFKSDEQEVKITVRLESDDFEIPTKSQEILVPRTGKSEEARFQIKPKCEGRGVVNVLFFKDGNFIQVVTLKFTIVDGEMFSEERLGRTGDAMFAVQPRNLNLTILDTGPTFQLIMTGPVAATATLPISKDYLNHKIIEARHVLQEEVVYMKDALGDYVYQERIDIPEEDNDLALRRLADVGYGLYESIFFSPDADPQVNNLGNKLREMARGDETLNIQIFSQHFMLPWGLLYMADVEEGEYDPDDVQPEWFLGLRHIIEHIPLQPNMHVTDSKIDSRAGLKVGLNVNKDIDEQIKAPLVATQLEYWGAFQGRGVSVIERDTVDELVDALKNAQSTTDQILYFYCHGITEDLEEGGPDASALVLSGQERLTLKELRRTGGRKILPGEPLVYINACESAQLSPLFYDGFVPYFMSRGARGVVGTECETPARFAVEWSQHCFDRFLAGEPLGQIFLDLRRKFYYDHKNLLGLLYALYVDGDTRIEPAVPAL